MSHPPVRLTQTSPLDWKVEIGGVDITRAVTGFTLNAAANCFAELVVDLHVLELHRLDLEHPKVFIPDSTAEALVALGWTAPEDAS